MVGSGDRTGSSTAPTEPATRPHGDQEPPGDAVPAGPAAAKAGRELEGAQDAEQAGADDVQHHRQGYAKNRAFSGVISAPPASSTRRTAPAANGMALSTISAVGTSHSALAGGGHDETTTFPAA